MTKGKGVKMAERERAIGLGIAVIARDSEENREFNYSDEHINMINKFSKVDLKRSDVYIRSMWLANDIIDSYYSRFNEKTLGDLAALTPGAPVLIGHQKEGLPIGKQFKAVKTYRDDGHWWLRTWFYFPKDMNHSENLERGIQTGLYDECSISWTYREAICSICGKDIRGCEHIPGKKYVTDAGEAKLCWWESEGIEQVLEASFVYKGGQVGTSIDEERKQLYAQRALILDKNVIDLASLKATSRDDGNVEEPGGSDNGHIGEEQPGDNTSQEQPAPEDSPQVKEESIKPEELDRIEQGSWKVCPNYDCQRVVIDGTKVIIVDNGKERDISERLKTIVKELEGNDKRYSGFIFKKRGNSRLSKQFFQRWYEDNYMDDHSIHIKIFDNDRSFSDKAHIQAIKFIETEKPVREACLNVGSKDGYIIFNDKQMYVVQDKREDVPAATQPKPEPVEVTKPQTDPGDLDGNEESKRKAKTQAGLYRVYNNKREFYQFAVGEGENLRWYQIPLAAASSIIIKEVESLDESRSMLLCNVEAAINDGVLSIKSDKISGSYRIVNSVLNGQRIRIGKLVQE